MKTNQPPAEAAVDEVLGARIVAWVLGEASAFEVAELERICGENPSIREFHRRMSHLHEMLGKAESSTGVGGWMLPPEKRRILEERIGAAGPKPVSQPGSFANKSARRALFGIAACLVVTLAVMRLLPGTKRSGVDIMGGAEAVLSAASPDSRIDYGDGWGSLEAAAADGSPDSQQYRYASPPAQLAALAPAPAPARGGRATVDRAPSPPASSLAEVVPNSSTGFETKTAGRSLELALENPNRSADTPDSAISALAGVVVTGGLRSGEATLSRDSIDTILNNAEKTPDLNGVTGIFGLVVPSEPAPPADAAPELAKRLMEMPAPALLQEMQDEALGDDIVAGPEPAAAPELMLPGLAAQDGLAASEDPAAAVPQRDSSLTSLSQTRSAGNSVELESARENPDRSPAPPDSSITWRGFSGDLQSGDEAISRGISADAKGLAGLARQEMLRGGDVVNDSDRLLLEGREAYSQGDYQQSVEKYRQAKDQLPDAPLLEERKSAYAGHLADASVALAQQHRKVGKYEEARQLLEGVLDPSVDPENALARAALEELVNPLRTNPALAAEHTQDVDEVRRSLYMAEGSLNLGKFDEAKREYENTLRIDPHNSDARRGLERVAGAKSDYSRAAYDNTRAELLAEVDAAWELSVPRDKEVVETLERAQEPELQAAEGELDLFAASKPAPVIEESETNPAETPYSTFSLNISDASFRIAAAAVERGERPDPGQVKAEQFYNAVDYGDPAPIGSEPVAGLVEQAAHPVVPNRNLVRIALRTAAAGRAASQPLRLTLVVDQSGSMLREDRRAALLSAAQQLGVLLGERDLVNVVGFSRTPRLIAEAIRGDDDARLVDALSQPADEGGTNLEEALKLAHEIAARHYDPLAQNRVVLLTDGAANLGDADPNTLSGRVVAMRQADLSLDVAGIGIDGLNDRLLAEIARHGNGRYHVLAASDQDGDDDAFTRQLAGAFRPAANDVKVQVVFNSERVSGYRLIGFQDDLLRPEDFRNDAVDAAELAAEEAGVALYQVQTDPEGSGDIGSVSVRFRESAGGEVVERSWIIPYEPAAPAFDRAPPSMQLAGLAMLAAEKLRGGEMANLIEFRNLAGSKAAVRSHYASSRQVGRLLSMIDAIE